MAVFRWTDKGGVDTYVKFDAVSMVELSRETDISEHPVEVGPDVTDHIRPRLLRASVTAFMSNSPLPSSDGVDKMASFQNIDLPRSVSGRFSQSLQNASFMQAGRDSMVQTPTKIYGLAWTDLRSRVREVREKLTEAQEYGYLLSLDDAAGDFDNLVIERFSTIRALEDGNGATIQLEVRQIRLTTVNEVGAPEARGQRPVDLGNQAPKPHPEPERVKEHMRPKSFLAAGIEREGEVIAWFLVSISHSPLPL